MPYGTFIERIHDHKNWPSCGYDPITIAAPYGLQRPSLRSWTENDRVNSTAAPRSQSGDLIRNNMKTYLLTAALIIAATPSFACTAEDLTAKATEVSQKMQELAAKNPQRAAAVAQKMTEGQAKTATDPNGACKLYDDILAELQ